VRQAAPETVHFFCPNPLGSSGVISLTPGQPFNARETLQEDPRPDSWLDTINFLQFFCNFFGWTLQPQHPPSDAPPAISVTLAEPPSVEGTGGGQTDEAELAAAAVELAACVDVSGISPGNSRGV
jgi:hypothetical protein